MENKFSFFYIINMATINLKRIKPQKVKYNREIDNHNSEFYNSLAWKRLRKTYFDLHPICECCLKHNRVTAAEDVHHKAFWDSFNTEELKWQKFLDERNLISLCSTCHYAMHNKARKYGTTFCDSLTDKEYREAHNI